MYVQNYWSGCEYTSFFWTVTETLSINSIYGVLETFLCHLQLLTKTCLALTSLRQTFCLNVHFLGYND